VPQTSTLVNPERPGEVARLVFKPTAEDFIVP